ncbi:MAG TPA: c-type cytochrome domain-containing protein, partial [Planctomycetia bacterium]|nr:c-type cytochrome domain-containing protein [Planctomycetia bacterium]
MSFRLRAALPWLFFLCSIASAPVAAAPPPRAAEELFESKIRPLFIAQCHECHGPKKQESGLRLDRREALLAGGDSQTSAIVPGNPEASLLVKALEHRGDFQMPPKRKLPQTDIAAVKEWIRLGAPFPAARAPEADATSKHWAIQPIADPALPAVKDEAWP